MEFLKRELAPITGVAWEEIDKRAKLVLTNHLTARKVVNVLGPKGRDFESISLGRMGLREKEGLYYGIYKTQPLVETRITFTMNRWELDNIERGAKDINFDKLDEAVKKAALFEDSAIFYGLEEGCIEGLNSSTQPTYDFGKTEEETLKNIIAAVYKLKDFCANHPYALVVSEEKWIYLNQASKDSSLVKKLEKILGAPIFVSSNIKEAFLLPYDDENMEMTIGMDYSIGYQVSDETEVKLFITSSFTFRPLDKNLIVMFS